MRTGLVISSLENQLSFFPFVFSPLRSDFSVRALGCAPFAFAVVAHVRVCVGVWSRVRACVCGCVCVYVYEFRVHLARTGCGARRPVCACGLLYALACLRVPACSDTPFITCWEHAGRLWTAFVEQVPLSIPLSGTVPPCRLDCAFCGCCCVGCGLPGVRVLSKNCRLIR